jgi:hypothetical protein
MNAVNTWKLADRHKILNPPNSREDTKMTIQKFAGALCYQFVTNTSAFVSLSLLQQRLLSEVLRPAISSISTQDISNVTKSSTEFKVNPPITIRSIKDNNGLLHHQVHYPGTVGKNEKRSTLTRERKFCKEKGVKKHLVGHYSLTCGECFAFCCPNKYNNGRDCFRDHVAAIK